MAHKSHSGYILGIHSEPHFVELDGLLQVETSTREIAFLSGYILFFAILHFALAILTRGKYVCFPFPDEEESITYAAVLNQTFLRLDECFSHINVHVNCLRMLLKSRI